LVVLLPVRQHNVYHIYFQAFTGQVKQLLKDPQELCCPISMHLMEDPVIAADGHTYERSFILKSFEVIFELRKEVLSFSTGVRTFALNHVRNSQQIQILIKFHLKFP